MPKITEEQKKKFYELYSQGCRSWLISRETGINRSYVLKVFHQFDSGDFTWLNSGYHDHEKAIPENEKRKIVQELSESDI